MAGWTNKGKAQVLGAALRAVALPTNYYVALVTSAVSPTADTNLMSDLTEIAAGNGYTSGGYSLTPGATDFDSLLENDGNDRGEIQIKDVVWNASGGSIPSSGTARWAVLTDDDGTVADREIYYFWDLVTDRQASDGNPFTLQDLEIRTTE